MKYTLILLSLVSFCHAAPSPSCEVTVAALNLPDNSDGLLHLRTAEIKETTPLQLSTRYFSPRIKTSESVVQFFANPLKADDLKPPLPLITVNLPEDAKLAYLIIFTTLDDKKQPVWKSILLLDTDWPQSCMKLLNASANTLGIQAGDQKIQLLTGKFTNFTSSQWTDTFSVVIYKLTPEIKTVFSSKWRITAGRRELSVLFNSGENIAISSLIDLQPPPKIPSR